MNYESDLPSYEDDEYAEESYLHVDEPSPLANLLTDYFVDDIDTIREIDFRELTGEGADDY